MVREFQSSLAGQLSNPDYKAVFHPNIYKIFNHNKEKYDRYNYIIEEREGSFKWEDPRPEIPEDIREIYL